MAAQMINAVLDAENKARKEQQGARIYAEKVIGEAQTKAESILNDSVEKAKNEAVSILKEADETAQGILQNANKLASMRKKKVISDTEKKYDTSIKLITENLL